MPPTPERERSRTGRVCAIRQFPFDTHLRREVETMLEAGHEVEVVCMWRPGEPRRERRGRLTIWRMPLTHRRGNAGRYVYEHSAFVLLATLWLSMRHLRRRFDLVQVNSPPDSLAFVAAVPKLMGAPVLLDLVECTPEFFATRFGTGTGHPLVRLLERVEQLAIRFADRAITGTAQMRERFVSRGADPASIDVVLNASDERLFDPSKAPVAARDGDERFTLISHGSIEPRYGLDTIVRAVALLAGELPGLRFEVYGEGSHREELRRLAAELGVDDRVTFSDGFVPIDELVAAIARADAGVVAVRRDPFRDLTHTNKMFDFIAMRRPAIVSWTQSVADYFDESALQYFRSGDPEDLARAIAELQRDPQRRERMVRRSADLHEHYRWSRQRGVYLGAIDRLLSPGR